MAKRPKLALGRRLKQAAHAAGFSAERISEKVGLSPAAVWAWWSGRSEPSSETLALYARETGVSVAWLISGAEEPMGPSGSLREWRLRFAAAMQESSDPEEAVNLITAGPEPPPSTDTTYFLGEPSPPPAAWHALTPPQQAVISTLIETLDQENQRLRHG